MRYYRFQFALDSAKLVYELQPIQYGKLWEIACQYKYLQNVLIFISSCKAFIVGLFKVNIPVWFIEGGEWTVIGPLGITYTSRFPRGDLNQYYWAELDALSEACEASQLYLKEIYYPKQKCQRL